MKTNSFAVNRLVDNFSENVYALDWKPEQLIVSRNVYTKRTQYYNPKKWFFTNSKLFIYYSDIRRMLYKYFRFVITALLKNKIEWIRSVKHSVRVGHRNTQ